MKYHSSICFIQAVTAKLAGDGKQMDEACRRGQSENLRIHGHRVVCTLISSLCQY